MPGATRYECELDDAPVSCAADFFAPSLRAGQHRFRVRALDTAGNASAFRTHDFRVRPPGAGVPSLSRTTVALGLRRAPGGATQAVTLFNDGGEDLAVEMPATTAPVGVTDDCPVDLASGGSCTVTFSYVGPPTGLQSRAVDLAPETAGGEVTVTVDGHPALGAPTAGELLAPTETSRRFTCAATESDVRRLQCALDQGTFTTCTSPADRTGPADGDHTFRVRQVSVDNELSPVLEIPFRVARAVTRTTAPTLAPADASRRPGSRFVATGGSYGGTTPITTALRWERCADATCAPILGATGTTYEATADDAGFGLRVVEIATNEVGPLERPTSPTSSAWSAPRTTGRSRRARRRCCSRAWPRATTACGCGRSRPTASSRR